MNKKATLSTNNITKSFGKGAAQLHVLKGVSALFEYGKSYAITGVSGTGKSTFLHVLAGIDAPTAGTVVFNGRDIATFTQGEREHFLNQSLGLVFQQPYLLKEFSVIENVMFKGLIKGMTHDECRTHAEKLLQKVELFDKAHAHPSSLSGGQQQRVALARALFNKPAFLLADEPTGNLDEATGKVIIDLLMACQREWGMGLVVSSHDSYVAQQMDVVLTMHNGHLTP